jgi:hypothetical protein
MTGWSRGVTVRSSFVAAPRVEEDERRGPTASLRSVLAPARRPPSRKPVRRADVALGGDSASRPYAFATTSPTSTLSKVIKSPGG